MNTIQQHIIFSTKLNLQEKPCFMLNTQALQHQMLMSVYKPKTIKQKK